MQSDNALSYFFVSVYGGVYLDFDEILLRPVENLRQYDYTQVSNSDKKII